MMAECEGSQRQLDLLAEPAGGSEVERALAPLVLVFGLGEQARAPAFWAVYREALGDLPKIALDRAAQEWPRVGKFFPKPAELRELARPHAEAFRQAAYRCRKALDAPAEPQPNKDLIPPDQFAALMADFAAKMNAKDTLGKARAKNQRPTPSAKVDERGMSAEARALIEKQRAA